MTALSWFEMSYEIRNAVLEDTVDIINLLESFHKEGHQNILTIDYDLAISSIHNQITDDDTAFRLCVEGDKIVGLYAGYRAREWSEEYLGYLNWFYVSPTHRKGRAALLLAKDLAEVVEEADIKIMYATSTAGMGKVNEEAFKKLFIKVGFIDQYGCLTRIA
jgi:N-acetylglutamate synthase-like GNAT family acetyltransferase